MNFAIHTDSLKLEKALPTDPPVTPDDMMAYGEDTYVIDTREWMFLPLIYLSFLLSRSSSGSRRIMDVNDPAFENKHHPWRTWRHKKGRFRCKGSKLPDDSHKQLCVCTNCTFVCLQERSWRNTNMRCTLPLLTHHRAPNDSQAVIGAWLLNSWRHFSNFQTSESNCHQEWETITFPSLSARSWSWRYQKLHNDSQQSTACTASSFHPIIQHSILTYTGSLDMISWIFPAEAFSLCITPACGNDKIHAFSSLMPSPVQNTFTLNNCIFIRMLYACLFPHFYPAFSKNRLDDLRFPAGILFPSKLFEVLISLSSPGFPIVLTLCSSPSHQSAPSHHHQHHFRYRR